MGPTMATCAETWKPTVQARAEGDVVVLRLSGRLGQAGARSAALQAALDGGRTARALILDLSGVDYVSSPGLALLLALVEEAELAHRGLVVCGVTDAVRIALDLADVGGRIPRASSVDEALEQFNTQHSE